jgi:hypothetical protein
VLVLKVYILLQLTRMFIVYISISIVFMVDMKIHALSH